MKNSINALYFLVHAENYPKWASQPAGWLVYPLSEWVIWKKKTEKRERERERDAEQGDARNRIENHCFSTYDFETCESIRIVRRQNRDSYE